MVTDGARNRHDLFARLEILEPRRALEGELDFVRIEDVEHDDVDAAELEVLQSADDRLGIVEQIRNQHDHPAFRERFGELVQRFRYVRLVRRPQAIERDEHRAVKAGEKPLDDRARLQLERPEARDNRRVEEPALARADVHYIPLLGTGTASSRRSTMWSDVIRSDSA